MILKISPFKKSNISVFKNGDTKRFVGCKVWEGLEIFKAVIRSEKTDSKNLVFLPADGPAPASLSFMSHIQIKWFE